MCFPPLTQNEIINTFNEHKCKKIAVMAGKKCLSSNLRNLGLDLAKTNDSTQ